MNKPRMTEEVIDDVDLPSIKKLILVVLACHEDSYGEDATPSVPQIADMTSVSERHVTSMLKELREDGILEVVKAATYHTPTAYRIRLDMAPRYGVGQVAER